MYHGHAPRACAYVNEGGFVDGKRIVAPCVVDGVQKTRGRDDAAANPSGSAAQCGRSTEATAAEYEVVRPAHECEVVVGIERGQRRHREAAG